MSRAHVIEIRLESSIQLFNSMDPSPFHERDLDHDAEEFIVSWAQEYPLKDPLRLVIHLKHPPEGIGPDQIEAAIRHYFSYRAMISRLEFDRHMKDARTSLFIGVTFLAVCLTLSHALGQGGRMDENAFGGWRGILSEVLLIAGWVAMWKPVDTVLYRWWPVLRLGRIYRKLSTVPVKIQVEPPKGAPGVPLAASDI